MVLRAVKSWTMALSMFAAVLLWWILAVLPTSTWWFEAHSLAIPDSVYGEEIILDVERDIHRQVSGEWTVVVRRLRDGGWSQYCVARGTSDYVPGARLPEPLTLDWWTEGRCSRLSPGTYIVTTSWVFEPRFTPTDRASPPLTSNPFRVLPRE